MPEFGMQSEENKDHFRSSVHRDPRNYVQLNNNTILIPAKKCTGNLLDCKLIEEKRSSINETFNVCPFLDEVNFFFLEIVFFSIVDAFLSSLKISVLKSAKRLNQYSHYLSISISMH